MKIVKSLHFSFMIKLLTQGGADIGFRDKGNNGHGVLLLDVIGKPSRPDGMAQLKKST
jgi:hypothetical protein